MTPKLDLTARLLEKAQQANLRLQPPATEAEVAAFESESGIDLPADYRDFLVSVANGGYGPCRLVALERWADCYWISKTSLSKHLQQPCLITPDAEDHEDQWLDKLGIEDLDGKWDREEWDPMFGSMAVAEIGCGLFFSLVVNGPFYGRVFSWGDSAGNPPVFVEQASFGEWMEFCLDAILEGHPVHFLDGRF